MLLGEHDHSLDDKNRLTLPAKLREQLGDEVVITRGLDGCLSVYSKAAFELLAQRMGTLDPFSRETRTMQRYFFTGAPPVELDRQGRMVIPAKLLESVGITREVTVADCPSSDWCTSRRSISLMLTSFASRVRAVMKALRRSGTTICAAAPTSSAQRIRCSNSS